MSDDERELQLGKGPVRRDSRTLKLASYIDAALPPPPESKDWLSKVKSWPMFGNDRIGDCVPAGAAHLVEAWTTNAGNATATLTDDDVISAYSAIAGYDPRTGANDNGCVMLDALNFWRRNGIGTHKITAYAKVQRRRHEQVRQALDLFGGLYVGAALPLAARSQLKSGTWRTGTGNSYRPGSWGGHCIHVGAYDADGLTCVTWGRTQRLTWQWWDTYVDEAYAIVTADWLGPGSKSPEGLDLFALLTDLRQVTQG